jgi:uncharacterized integral membrane protein
MRWALRCGQLAERPGKFGGTMIRKLVSALVVLPLGLVLVVFAVANRHPVTVSLDPLGSDAAAFSGTVPLFLLILLMLVIGVVAGGIAAWFNQAKWRRAARRLDAEARALRSENEGLKTELAAREPRALPAPARVA